MYNAWTVIYNKQTLYVEILLLGNLGWVLGCEPTPVVLDTWSEVNDHNTLV